MINDVFLAWILVVMSFVSLSVAPFIITSSIARSCPPVARLVGAQSKE